MASSSSWFSAFSPSQIDWSTLGKEVGLGAIFGFRHRLCGQKKAMKAVLIVIGMLLLLAVFLVAKGDHHRTVGRVGSHLRSKHQLQSSHGDNLPVRPAPRRPDPGLRRFRRRFLTRIPRRLKSRYAGRHTRAAYRSLRPAIRQCAKPPTPQKPASCNILMTSNMLVTPFDVYLGEPFVQLAALHKKRGGQGYPSSPRIVFVLPNVDHVAVVFHKDVVTPQMPQSMDAVHVKYKQTAFFKTRLRHSKK